MTNAEAIEILKKHDPWPLWSLKAHVAIDMAISALKKQEGKKPKVVPNEFQKYTEDWNDYVCPRCGKPIISKINGEWFCGKKICFCDICGQHIDWSGEHGAD